MIAHSFARLSRNQPDVYLVRFKRGGYRGGVFESVPERPRKILAVVQPLTHDELQTIGGLTKTSTHVRVFTTEPLYLTDVGAGRQSDELVIGTDQYRVDQVEPHLSLSLGHYSSIAVRISS